MNLPYRGGAASLLLVALLLTPPAELVEREGVYADTKGNALSAAAIPVELRDGLRGDPADVIPRTIGNWTGVDDESWSASLATWLAYDSLFVRDYSRPGFYVPVQVMILTARHARAFHDPEVCFTVQGGEVKSLEGTSVPAPASPDGARAPVGRMLISHEENPSRLVYNLYIVERHLAAADRTTWIRLSFMGVDESDPGALEPYLVELLDAIAPHLFQGAGDARTTVGWLADRGGFALAGFAVALALLPVSAETAWLRRRPA